MDLHSIVPTTTAELIHLRKLFEHNELVLSIADSGSDVVKAGGSIVSKDIIHFYFCLEGGATFIFGPHYSREIEKKRNYFFYNPERDLPFSLELKPHTKMVFLSIALDELHKLFVHEPLPFMNPGNVKTTLYDEREIPSSLHVVLNQLFTMKLSAVSERLYFQSKALEILSLYFSERAPDTESCPFLNDQEAVRKIKQAKEYLMKNIESPPSLKDLSRMAGLNEYQLKAGFKEIYGSTVFGYVLDHKLDHARVLLDSRKHQVNEVAYQVGYANPSHFIAAFKKKFGITPKKYLMNKG